MGIYKRPMARYRRSNLRCFRKRYVANQVLRAWGDWREEAFQKLISMRESYMPELNEMYQKISGKLQLRESLPQQPTSEQLEKLKAFLVMLGRVIAILKVKKADIVPTFKEKLVHYDKQLRNFINTSRPRKVPDAARIEDQLSRPRRSARIQARRNLLSMKLSIVNEVR